jgi:hypothetical protein
MEKRQESSGGVIIPASEDDSVPLRKALFQSKTDLDRRIHFGHG